MWPDNWNTTDLAFPPVWIDSHIKESRKLGKPLLLEEFGKQSNAVLALGRRRRQRRDDGADRRRDVEHDHEDHEEHQLAVAGEEGGRVRCQGRGWWDRRRGVDRELENDPYEISQQRRKKNLEFAFSNGTTLFCCSFCFPFFKLFFTFRF